MTGEFGHFAVGGPCTRIDWWGAGRFIIEVGGKEFRFEDSDRGGEAAKWRVGAVSDTETSDYLKYRGKCKEMSEQLCATDPTLTLVRGYYVDAIWGEQPHWWCKQPDGTIVDPTKNQFPTKGAGNYVEFDGNVACANCGKSIREEDADIDGMYAFCSYECHGKFVGAF